MGDERKKNKVHHNDQNVVMTLWNTSQERLETCNASRHPSNADEVKNVLDNREARELTLSDLANVSVLKITKSRKEASGVVGEARDSVDDGGVDVFSGTLALADAINNGSSL